MLKTLKIGSKISFLVLLMVILTVGAVSYIAYHFNRDSLQKKYFDTLTVIAGQKAEKINVYFRNIGSVVSFVQEIEPLKDIINDWEFSENHEGMNTYMAPVVKAHNLKNLLVSKLNGTIIYDAKGNAGEKIFDTDGRTVRESRSGLYLSGVSRRGAQQVMYAGAPLYNSDNEVKLLLFVEIDLDAVFAIANDTLGLGNTGEVILAYADNKDVWYLNPLRNYKKEALSRAENLIEGQPLWNAIEGNKGRGTTIDYRKQEVLAAWDKIPIVGWGIMAKIDVVEIYREVRKLYGRFLMAGIIIIILSGFSTVIFSSILINPLLSLKETLKMVAKGILPNQVLKKSNDEIGQMAETMDNLVQALRRTADFAHSIGAGDYKADFQPLSDKDILGTSLINMRNNIQESEKKDKERNWIVTGLAQIGEILRSHDNLEQLGDEIIAYVTNKINAIQGAFYVVNDDDEDNVFIEMKASYAYGKKKFLNGTYKFAQGLIGQAAIEQTTLLRTEIPNDYVTLTSGLLGEQKPKCILIVPLITDEKVFGSLEFAGLEKFSDSQVKFIQELSLTIARTIFNIKVNERTKRLLAESQTMSNELQQQQEILRQNAEEMESTQEELKRTNHRLEEQIEEVNRTQKRMQLLLENASEVITIYEKDGIVRYISPSVKTILGYAQDEMMGIKDIKYVHPDGVEAVNQMFKDLLAKPSEPVTIQYVYIRKDGQPIWLEATGNNQLSDSAIQGIIVNSRDITERRRAELEERMRTKMQALSENSPDLISRFDKTGNFFYINPVIETYTGNRPDHYMNKAYQEVELPNAIIEQWEKILTAVSQSNNKMSLEMEFPSLMGERVMQVNAIPEFDDKEILESILMVSHDITDRKLIELDVQSKNKKITESINYAKRIQGAILPDTLLLKKTFPESFILYKARDVVSGDFPWFLPMGEDVFIATVDCTGHGVPGALISLIGYFLLNDIVRSGKVVDPGEILDCLDREVTKTLRQDQDDSRTKDGMDISLCRINKEKREVAYAGAHRPLYFMKNGELIEVKGERFPIGGGIFKNQTNFTTTMLDVGPGDSIYFCSDGFPDQFGGPENRKFGPKRLREMISQYHHNKMSKIYEIIENEWEEWKGDKKQTDDVLLIGIKF
jgi:PAS domain S-box-containing protein